jgi:hypothetical protein
MIADRCQRRYALRGDAGAAEPAPAWRCGQPHGATGGPPDRAVGARPLAGGSLLAEAQEVCAWSRVVYLRPLLSTRLLVPVRLGDLDTASPNDAVPIYPADDDQKRPGWPPIKASRSVAPPPRLGSVPPQTDDLSAPSLNLDQLAPPARSEFLDYKHAVSGTKRLDPARIAPNAPRFRGCANGHHHKNDPNPRESIHQTRPGFPIWTHFLFPRTLLSERRALQPGMSPIQNR